MGDDRMMTMEERGVKNRQPIEMKMSMENPNQTKPEEQATLASVTCSAASPAEVYLVWDFVKEEMEARGWTLDDLIDHLPGDQAVNRLALEFMESEPHFDANIRRDMRLGEDMAAALAQAFGTSKEFWLNIDAAWVKQQNTELKHAEPKPPCVPGVTEQPEDANRRCL